MLDWGYWLGTIASSGAVATFVSGVAFVALKGHYDDRLARRVDQMKKDTDEAIERLRADLIHKNDVLRANLEDALRRERLRSDLLTTKRFDVGATMFGYLRTWNDAYRELGIFGESWMTKVQRVEKAELEFNAFWNANVIYISTDVRNLIVRLTDRFSGHLRKIKLLNMSTEHQANDYAGVQSELSQWNQRPTVVSVDVVELALRADLNGEQLDWSAVNNAIAREQADSSKSQ